MSGPFSAIEAIQPAAGAAAAGGIGAPGSATAVPTAHEASAFADAVAQAEPAGQVNASLPSSSATHGLAAELADKADAFAKHIGSVGHGPDAAKAATEPPPAAGIAGMKAVLDQSLDSMHGAYMFAVETTMASRGSTETTKIFNTLLKGQ